MKHLIQVRPSVHLLCSGVFLQGPVELEGRAIFVPIKPLGSEKRAQWLALYAQECGAPVDGVSLQKLIDQGAAENPCIAIVCPVRKWNGPEQAEAEATNHLETLRELLSWGTGNDVDPFGFVVLGPREEEAFFRPLLPQTKKRTRLGFGNTGNDFVRSLTSIIESAERDEHFAFALSMLHDANKEENKRFKIARLYSCLESLSYKIKKGQGSRDAVRVLLGLSKGKTGQVSISGRTYDYDVVLGAGILRDLLFHGVQADFSKAREDEKDTFDLIQNHPEVFVDDLQSRVELEVARWSNGASNGQKAE